MFITQTSGRLTIRSVQQIKLFMAIVFIVLGLLILVNLSFQDITPKNLVGLVFTVPGFLLLLDVSYVYVVLDKAGPSKFMYRKIRSSDATEFSIGDVQEVRKVEYLGIGNGSTGPNDILQLVVRGKGRLEIASTRQQGILVRIFRPYRRQGKRIGDFIGVDFKIKKINLQKEFAANPRQDEPV